MKIKYIKKINLVIFLLISFMSTVQAAWVGTTTSGTIESVRSYQIGASGLRAEITVSGASHNCGVQPNIFYFDTGNVTTDVVKVITSLAFGAMAAGKEVFIHYDCELNASGYGWGVALKVLK